MNMRSKGSFIADAVAYLATVDFVTGQGLVVDGGRSLVWQNLMGLCFSKIVEVLSIKLVSLFSPNRLNCSRPTDLTVSGKKG